MNNFEDWLQEIEVFGTRKERMLDDLVYTVACDYDERVEDVMKWLKAAYEVGHEAGVKSQRNRITELEEIISGLTEGRGYGV